MGTWKESKKYLDNGGNIDIMDEIGRSPLIAAIDCDKRENN